MAGSDPLLLDGRSLSIESFFQVTNEHRPVGLAPAASVDVDASRAAVDSILERGETVYGVNTGFGELATVRIADEDLGRLQSNLIRSHAVGVGEPFDLSVTRGLVLLRANVLANGHSGVRRIVLERLLDFLNHGIHPWIPSQGSVGASGDLAPLAHLALVLVGEGEVHGPHGSPAPSGPALEAAGLKPITLQAKEGLALINGTQAMTSLGALAVHGASRLARTADLIGAMTIEARLASHSPFDSRLHRLRPHPGQQACAANLRRLLQGGNLNASHADCGRVQDAYSLRCMPQVHGAARQTIVHAGEVVSIELNSVTDNPTVFPEDGDVLSGGNFHGQPIATALDCLAIGMCELGSISERRIEQLVNPKLAQDLPPFLIEDPGLNSGLMMAQVTAAALASENKSLCSPASVDSIPTSAGQEDHVSMGPIAGRMALRALRNCQHILAIELLAAAQALDFRAPLQPADGPRAAYAFVRARIPHIAGDRNLQQDLRAAHAMIESGALLHAVESELGALD